MTKADDVLRRLDIDAQIFGDCPVGNAVRDAAALIREQDDAIDMYAARAQEADDKLAAEELRSQALRDSIDGCAQKVAALIDDLHTEQRRTERYLERAERAEAERDAAIKAIAEHNDDLQAACDARRGPHGCDSYIKRGRACPDCPREWVIDAAIARAGEK